MGQLKAKTLLEQFGFVDTDKKNLKHDTIQTWAYDNIEEVLKSVLPDRPAKVEKKKWEHQITSNNYNSKYLIGAIDLKFDCRDFKGYPFDVYIEVKTSIPIVGELLRQLSAYKEFISNADNLFSTVIIVISPDNTHERMIKEQGYLFYKYIDPTKLF